MLLLLFDQTFFFEHFLEAKLVFELGGFEGASTIKYCNLKVLRNGGLTLLPTIDEGCGVAKEQQCLVALIDLLQGVE